MRSLAILICFYCFTLCGYSQGDSSSPIIFIYDASGSMWGQMDGKTKMEIASEVLSTSVAKLGADQSIGLVAYGHRQKGDCRDVETLVAMDNRSKDAIDSALKKVKPLGKTPLAYSAQLVIDELRTTKKQATIILITDGIESCDGNICEVVRAAKAEGINFLLNIVGFGLKKGETEQLECAANAGGGNYYDAANAAALGDVLTEATEQTVDKPAGNVSVYATKNGEAIDAYVKAYDMVAKRKPIAVRTYRDTGYVYLPPSTYNLEVKPLEGSDVDAIVVENVQSFEDKIVHRDVSFDGGKFVIRTTNNGEGQDSSLKVYKQDGTRVAAGRTYAKSKTVEVNPGTYDIEVHGLQIFGLDVKHRIEDVVIQAGEEKEVIHDFKTGIANLGVSENGTLIDCTVSIYDAATETSIVGRRSYTSPNSNPRAFVLNPGNYKVRLRGRKNGKDQIKWFEFTVKAGESFTKMYDW
ncbi:MAG: VWA domain-containing protein [Bacteroidota bacterium]